MDDLISRQAAIAEFSCCELTPDGGIDANYAIDFLKQMPSAEPNLQQTCNKLATDCISRQDAIDALAYFTEKSPTGRTAQEVVKALPSAQPERKNGRWLSGAQDFTNGVKTHECSVCGGFIDLYSGGADDYYFCPYCGTNMRGEDDERSG